MERDNTIKTGDLPSSRNQIYIRNDKAHLDLDSWMKSDIPIAVVNGDGGFGKTTVVRRWLQESEAVRNGVERAVGHSWLAIHSFYGQTASENSVVDDALRDILVSLLGKDAMVHSSAVRLERILKAGAEGGMLLVLDGLETQQDKAGYIEGSALPMDELISKLSQLPACKILITSRKDLHLYRPARQKLIKIEGFDRRSVEEFLEADLALDKEGVSTLSNNFFPSRTTPLVVSVFADLAKAGRLDTHREAIIKTMRSTTDPEHDPIVDLFRILRQGMAVGVQKVLEVVAISDAPLPTADIGRIIADGTDGDADLDAFAGLHLSLDPQPELWDLHPKVRDAIRNVLEEDNPQRFRELHGKFGALYEERAAAPAGELGALRLSFLYRSLTHWLKSSDPMHGLLKVYIEKISGDRIDQMGEKEAWRSVRQDFAYRHEFLALEAVLKTLEALLKQKAAVDDLVNSARYRLSMVARGLGEMDIAEEQTKHLADIERARSNDVNATGQLVLTNLMRGNVDLPPDKMSGALYWVERTDELAAACKPKRGIYPSVRANVYAGAYHHRMGNQVEADEKFLNAEQLQSEMYAQDPTKPENLIGLNAFLQCWFLVESGGTERALTAVQNCRRDVSRLRAQGVDDANADQWEVMADITEAWVQQEHALATASTQSAAAQRAFDRSRILLGELEQLERTGEFKIPFDMGVIHVRVGARSMAMTGKPDAAIELLRKQVAIYERRGVILYAADCQADILRILNSHKTLTAEWDRPAVIEVQDELDKLVALTTHYPLGRSLWHDMPKLQAFEIGAVP
ncbi:NACHT domain-containing protein [uncultured Devosia sp.]|uniref:NACHT domain-containing protein n=1 Tax=uncultured Devosia sp. TaxID=211434 RepID=UPI00263403B5|nr:NACHT domain-containing protein [uncultured Devosia sp.]